MSDRINTDHININRICQLLPHRYPFILVDRILDMTLGESITGLKNVTINEPFFQGHFPDSPVMPGVLMTEGMAQVSGILAKLTAEETQDTTLKYLLLAAMDRVKFKQVVIPGDTIIYDAKLLNHRGNYWKFDAVCRVEDQIVASGSMTIVTVEKESINEY